MRIKNTALIIVFVFFTQFIQAQNYELNAHLSKNRILVGDTLALTLDIAVPSNYKVYFPVLLDTISKGVEIVGEPKVDSLLSGDMKSYTKTFIISAYDSAMYVFGHLPAVIINENKADTVYSNDMTLFVDYQQLNENLETKIDTALQDKIVVIKPNLETPFTWLEFWLRLKQFMKKYWYFVLAAVVLIAFGLYWYFVIRKKTTQTHIAPVVIVKPHIEAVNKLDALAEKKLWQQGKTKEYFSELSNILRLYLERQFKIIALESTTDTISRQMRYYKHTSTELEKDLHSLLQLADYVKFAKYKAMPAECTKALERAYNFVEQTKPKEKIIEETENINTEQK